MNNITPGIRIHLRGEDFLVTGCEHDIIDAEGISELVNGMKFKFDLRLEEYEVIQPENTNLQVDTSPKYRLTKLFLETIFRNSSHFSDSIEIAHKAAIKGANYQFVSTLKALKLPKPRILIADAVGLGKTVQVGIFMAELIRRGKGKKILVITPKSILAQFQQEIWARFAIPLVRLDSQGIAKIREEIPPNKNPFDYYDKVIVSIDTLKDNAKFRHNLEKVKWDIVAIDECHNVANSRSQRGTLAKFLAERTDALVLTSATPHNGKKENFANLISLIDPTAIPYTGDFDNEVIKDLFVRRFKKDVESEVGDSFKDRVTQTLTGTLTTQEEEALRIIRDFKTKAYEESEGDLSYGTLLFSIGLFKAFMSSPAACLETVLKRMDKDEIDSGELIVLKELKVLLSSILSNKEDSKFHRLLMHLDGLKWKGGKKDDRIIIFTERRKTLGYLREQLQSTYKLKDDSIAEFHGSLTDSMQQDILEDFGKEDSKIRLFLASDAASQGVNLHYYCNQMINYDIPWSIITLDQRNGRIDRFGQKNTPYIYYLIAESSSDDIQGDIRILEKLKDKEEEVYKTLGDAGNVLKLFDAQNEEKLIKQAIATSDDTLLDQDQEEDNSDWLDGLVDEYQPEEGNKVEMDDGFKSFYSDDFAFYLALMEEIEVVDEKIRGKFFVEKEDQILEIVQNDELSINGVLYDMPTEAFPDKKDTFKLTTNQHLVESAIETARKKQKAWPSHHLLYDLHPIAKWMQYKLLAQVDRGSAMVARMRKPLPEKSAWFIFQGITSNGQGKPIFSKSFVVNKSWDGKSSMSLETFTEFMDEFRLIDSLPTLEVEDNHLKKIKELLPLAVDTAKKTYKHKLQGDLDDEMEKKLQEFEAHLHNWLTDSEKQMTIDFGEEETGKMSYHKKRRRKEVESVKQKMEEFYNEYFQLENEPFIRLLAVFYNA